MRKVFATLIALCATSLTFATVVQLPQLAANRTQVSVSGLSSGAAAAVQYDVAFSKDVIGAGIIAGVPYYCAQNNLFIATTTCMSGKPNIIPLIKHTKIAAYNKYIDSVSNLEKQRIWLYSGTKDETVKQSVMNTAYNYYSNFVPAKNIKYVNDQSAGHAFITDDFGNKCDSSATPFINNCGYDSAGKLLSWIYKGDLNPKAESLSGKLLTFDQTPFTTIYSGMAKTGFVYVPSSCQSNSGCKIHVVFHGCKQNKLTVGNAVPTQTEYDAWADTNNMIILYPQTMNNAMVGNPYGCWDWWGYTGVFYAYKGGLQMSAVHKMVEHLILKR